ncbi:hypothetical protein IFM61606_07464 [Aspergillus udagawae]|uniref:Uncharacterized protein n=1 Tax=Aspergillus udagawae TaxID=91492 RepID=A0ABQ1BBF6_9EURO|nr:hypothetical protein IFM51744_05454 [Aspergillus udagawae]GFF97798.1 hypothetical protein IFM53868_09426 [Aspergillus udagawae]GFG14994.1 hypothetical protein IFM5058_07227 [Aspergillus udagawae]GFG27430.1 hypothetical protein IFM61606_07464 [Aspergillus udagawae]
MRQKTTSRLPAHLSLQHSSVQILHPKAFSPVSIIITTSALSHQPRVRHQLLPHTRVLFKDTMNYTSTELIALKSPMTKNASLVFFLHTAAKIIILLAIVDVLRVLLRQVQVYLDQHGHEHHEIHGPQRVRLVRRRRRRFDDDVLGFPF